MTTVGYDKIINNVRIADLNRHLNEYLRKVCQGRRITVPDRDTPIARIQLRQPNPLKQWPTIEQDIGSALAEVECLRTLDRLRLAEGLTHEEMAVRREAVFRFIEAMEIVEATRPAQPLPTSLGTLDAIHLTTARLWRERTSAHLVMATHDGSLATAARASG